jgi:hypothetical protein
MHVAVWRVDQDGPRRAPYAVLQLEKHLEDWIERDPSLVEEGLRIVGRQVVLESGRLDLLGVDSDGGFVVVEVKRNTLSRDTLAQALDYAATIAAMQPETLGAVITDYLAQRGHEDAEAQAAQMLVAAHDDEGTGLRVSVLVAGRGRDPSLDRLAGFLADGYGVPITVASFLTFDMGAGQTALVREVRSSEMAAPAAGWSYDVVLARAERHGIGDLFRAIKQAADRNGLYARPSKKSILYAPPTMRTRSLFTVNSDASAGKDRIGVWAYPMTFAEFFPPLTAESVQAELGFNGYAPLDQTGVTAFGVALDRLFAEVRNAGAGPVRTQDVGLDEDDGSDPAWDAAPLSGAETRPES